LTDIEVGQSVRVPYLGWNNYLAFFRFTAPGNGTVAVRVSWGPASGPWDYGWYSLTYGTRRFGGDTEIVAKIPVVAGQTYWFIVENCCVWDFDPGFVLTTSIE
jgi:hypothetical protein